MMHARDVKPFVSLLAFASAFLLCCMLAPPRDSFADAAVSFPQDVPQWIGRTHDYITKAPSVTGATSIGSPDGSWTNTYGPPATFDQYREVIPSAFFGSAIWIGFIIVPAVLLGFAASRLQRDAWSLSRAGALFATAMVLMSLVYAAYCSAMSFMQYGVGCLDTTDGKSTRSDCGSYWLHPHWPVGVTVAALLVTALHVLIRRRERPENVDPTSHNKNLVPLVKGAVFSLNRRLSQPHNCG